jgi:hypothetical protein
MGKYLGDFVEDAIVRGSFNTRDAAGAPITLAGTPAVSVYKDAGATESTAGVTLTVDFDSRTGHHIYTIDTSADAFYATGADYRVVLTAGTVDGVSVVGVEVGAFSIQNRFIRSEPPTAAGNATQVRAELAAELAQIDATNDRTSLIYTLLQLTDADVAVLITRIAGTIRTAADDVTAETAQTAAIRDGLATATNVSDAQTAIANILGTPSGASLAADIAAIELDPEIIVNPTELSNESIEAIDEYFYNNLRFKATVDGQQFILWAKNEDGEKIATLAKQDEIIEDIAGIEGGGGASINVLPAVGIVANRAPGVTLQPVVGETISQSITLYATDGTTPINLIGKTLVAVFETLQGIDVATVPNSSIAVGGSSNNVVTFSYPSIVTSAERTLRFALRDAAAPLTMYLQGLCVVTRAPQVDA